MASYCGECKKKIKDTEVCQCQLRQEECFYCGKITNGWRKRGQKIICQECEKEREEINARYKDGK
jgi:hypothetical protein